MDALFHTYLRAGLSGGIIILLVLLLRLCLKKAPRQMVCILWILVAARLVLPFTLESRLSLQPELPAFSDAVVRQPVTPPVQMPDAPPVQMPDAPPVSQPQQNIPPVTAPPVTAPEPQKTVTLGQMVPIIWMCGAGLTAAYGIVSYLLLKRRLRDTVKEEDYRISDRIKGAFVMGYLKPRIYLPAHTESQDRPHIVAHEQAHIARGDHWWKLLGFVCLCLHWYNPLVWLSFVLFGRDTEVACDERVVWGMALEERKAYSMALLNCGRQMSGLTALTLCFGKESLKQRIKNVLTFRKPGIWITALAGMLAVAIAVFFLTSPEKSEPKPTDPTDNTTVPATQGPTDGTTVPPTIGMPTTVPADPTTVPTDPITVPSTTAPVETVPPTMTPVETVPPTTAPPATQPPETEPPTTETLAVYSGSCGDFAKWTLKDGVLTISGRKRVGWPHCWIDYADIITEIVIEDGITGISDYAFSDLVNVKSVHLGDTMETIGMYAFRDCAALQTIVFPDSLSVIEYSAFSNCVSLESITFSAGPTKIENYAFANCARLKELIFLPNCGLESIGEGAFAHTGITAFITPPSLRTIGPFAFMECNSLETVILEGGVSDVQPRVFENCVNLKTFIVGESVTRIHWPINGCDAVERLEIYSSVAFTNLQTLTSLKTLVVGGKANQLMRFFGCTSLESVTINVPITEIPDYTFGGCASLKTISLPNTVISIGDSAFSGTGLTDIILPASLQTIENGAFRNTNITEIVIPTSVEKIGSGAFMNCPLKEITFLGNAPEIIASTENIVMDGAFENVTATVYYPTDNPTWTEEKLRNYGGTLTWVALN